MPAAALTVLVPRSDTFGVETQQATATGPDFPESTSDAAKRDPDMKTQPQPGAQAVDSPTLQPRKVSTAPPIPLEKFRPQAVRPTPTPRVTLLKHWEGYVQEVSNGSFVARLIDLEEDVPDEEAEIYLEEVTPDDRDLVAPGAVFYWMIGYRQQASGQRERVSGIRFRRLPQLTQRDIELAKAQAQEAVGRIRNT